jgi:hypothetical protein
MDLMKASLKFLWPLSSVDFNYRQDPPINSRSKVLPIYWAASSSWFISAEDGGCIASQWQNFNDLIVCHLLCFNTLRSNITITLYTTLYYCILKRYMFRPYETANIRPHVSEIHKSKSYSCTLNSKDHTTSLHVFLKRGAWWRLSCTAEIWCFLNYYSKVFCVDWLFYWCVLCSVRGNWSPTA